MKMIALITFIGVYVLLLVLPKYRAFVALGAAALFAVLGIVPIGEIAGVIDWNVLLMLAGTMGTVDLFIRSNNTLTSIKSFVFNAYKKTFQRRTGKQNK